MFLAAWVVGVLTRRWWAVAIAAALIGWAASALQGVDDPLVAGGFLSQAGLAFLLGAAGILMKRAGYGPRRRGPSPPAT